MICSDSMLQRQQSWNETNKHIDDQSYPRFVIFSLQILKREVYHYAQVDFDFGQVHFVWWLSYCQAGEKISVEPYNVHTRICSVEVSRWSIVTPKTLISVWDWRQTSLLIVSFCDSTYSDYIIMSLNLDGLAFIPLSSNHFNEIWQLFLKLDKIIILCTLCESSVIKMNISRLIGFSMACFNVLGLG